MGHESAIIWLKRNDKASIMLSPDWTQHEPRRQLPKARLTSDGCMKRLISSKALRICNVVVCFPWNALPYSLHRRFEGIAGLQ